MNVKDVIKANIKGGVARAKNSWWKLILLGILAGMFIGLGAVASSMAAHGISDTGQARLITGLIFPVGLVMVVLLGAELFTGNVLMLGALVDKKIGIKGLLKNWGFVYLGNFIGSIVLALVIAFGGELSIGGGDLAVYTAKVAATKNMLPWSSGLALGMFCNFLVCAAIFMALTAKTTIGKIMAIWPPTAAFVIAGFEHSVANMYYVSAGIFAYLNPAYTEMIIEAGVNVEALSFSAFFVNNLIPVTIGNIIGGAIFGLTLYYVYGYKKSARRQSAKQKIKYTNTQGFHLQPLLNSISHQGKKVKSFKLTIKR